MPVTWHNLQYILHPLSSRNANKKAEESKQQAAKKVEEAVEALEQVPHAISMADVEVTDDAEAITADSLDPEKDTPQSLAILLSKIALVSARESKVINLNVPYYLVAYLCRTISEAGCNRWPLRSSGCFCTIACFPLMHDLELR